MNYSYKVRFNLGKGENYRKWKISNGKTANYLDPSKCCLVLKDCYLYNNTNIANKIYEGSHKKVCAWIYCNYLHVNLPLNIDFSDLYQIEYNPKLSPNWMAKGKNIDKFCFLFTSIF